MICVSSSFSHDMPLPATRAGPYILRVACRDSLRLAISHGVCKLRRVSLVLLTASCTHGPVARIITDHTLNRDRVSRGTSVPYENNNNPASIPVAESSSSIVEAVSEGNRSVEYHPSACINQFLLDSFPEVMVAVTHDQEWASVIRQDEKMMPANSDLLSRIKGKYSVSKSGLGAFFVELKPATSMRNYAPPTFPALTSALGASPPPTSGGSGGSGGRNHWDDQLNNYAAGRGVGLRYEDSQTGPLSNPTWTSIAFLNGYQYGTGTGSTKGSAREGAAYQTLLLIQQGF